MYEIVNKDELLRERERFRKIFKSALLKEIKREEEKRDFGGCILQSFDRQG